jgi:hypothetical protein
MIVLAIGSDNLIRWDHLADARTEAYLDDAVVTFTLKNSAGQPVAGAENVPLEFANGSDGRYEGILESTVALSPGANYILELTAVRGQLVGFRRLGCVAAYAGEC